MEHSLTGLINGYDSLRNEVSARHEIPVSDRILYLNSLKQGIIDHLPEIRLALQSDLGKATLETDSSEVAPVLVEIRHALKNIKRWTRRRRTRSPFFLPGTLASVVAEPKGLVLILSPFNYPLNLSLGPLVSALAAGNRAIIKPSEHTPATSAELAKVVADSLPATVAMVALGGIPTARALVDREFDHIFFSGSPRIGKIIMADAAQFATPVTLELGGKSPAIVTSNADIELAVRKIAAAKFLNAGQTCIGVDYALVDQSIHDEFVDKLVKHLSLVYGSTPGEWIECESFGKVVSEDHTARLSDLLKQSKAEGGDIVFGGHTEIRQRFVAPTVVTNVDVNNALMSEEIFGPILPIIKTNSNADALVTVNQLPDALTVHVFSKSRQEDEYFRVNTRSGSIVTNDVLSHFVHPNIPFGGSGDSGFGRAHGHAGFQTFSNERAVVRNRNHIRNPLELLFPPYTKRIEKLLRRVLPKL